jgi:hypothetical protein
MREIRTTVVVAPREQFGWTRPALESIFSSLLVEAMHRRVTGQDLERRPELRECEQTAACPVVPWRK